MTTTNVGSYGAACTTDANCPLEYHMIYNDTVSGNIYANLTYSMACISSACGARTCTMPNSCPSGYRCEIEGATTRCFKQMLNELAITSAWNDCNFVGCSAGQSTCDTAGCTVAKGYTCRQFWYSDGINPASPPFKCLATTLPGSGSAIVFNLAFVALFTFAMMI